MSPQEVLASTTPEVRSIIEKIVAIERENKDFNLTANRPKERAMVEEIIKVIYEGTK